MLVHFKLGPRARQLYVVSAPGKIAVAAFPHLRMVTTLDVGRSARDLQFSPDGRAAYVLNPADHEVVFLDCGGAAGNPPAAAVPKIVFRLRLAGTLRDLALSPDGKTLVAASENPNRITFISTETRRALGTTEVGQSPGPMVILPDNSKVFVADSGEEKISAAALTPQKLFSHIDMIGVPPTATAQRGLACPPIQPMTGPPMNVEPRKATVHRDMTLPRMVWLLSSCSTVFPRA